jgi:proline dehydrogenase
MGLARALLLKGSESEWLAEQASQRRFVQRATRRFMPGESMDDALDAARDLSERGMASILTLLGENVEDEAAAESVASAYEELLSRRPDTGLDLDISVKPTHLGLEVGLEVAARNLQRLARAASERDALVVIDMESSAFLPPTLELYRALRAKHENAGVCLQAYLYRTPADLEILLPLKPMIRLVKGAYKEPSEIAYPRKRDVDTAFGRLAGQLLEAAREGQAQVAFGTHDEKLIHEINRMAAGMGCPRDGYEIQMLYGIRRDLQARLVEDGYRVRVLISYGTHWFPWYMRRLAERPANVGFVLRSLFGG